MVAYADAAAAIDWLTEAFGFRERDGQRYTDDRGTVVAGDARQRGELPGQPRRGARQGIDPSRTLMLRQRISRAAISNSNH